MSPKGINKNKEDFEDECWLYADFIFFHKRIDFRMSLNVKITLRYIINSLWTEVQFPLSRN